MSLIKKILIIFFLLFPISNSLGEMVTHVQTNTFLDGPHTVGENENESDEFQSRSLNGIHFNDDGTKLFTSYNMKPKLDNVKDTFQYIHEYNLSIPYDISTRTYAGNDERCELGSGSDGHTGDRAHDLEFSSDGMKLFTSDKTIDNLFRFDLTSPYDVSTCSFVYETTTVDTKDLQNGSNAGDSSNDTDDDSADNRLQGFEINEDGTKLFLLFHDVGALPRLHEYSLSTPFDFRTLSLTKTAGIPLTGHANNPNTMRFSNNGKRIFVVSHGGTFNVTQISLNSAYDTSSFTIDGSVSLTSISGASTLNQPRGIAFSSSGLKLYIGHDTTSSIFEFNLVCPFNIITGKCPPITENSDRTGIAIAQIEIAKRTIDQSTDTALNRLKWIRRNKDKQNLTNLNINFNFNNQRLASLTEVVRTSAAKKKKKDKDENRDIFYWSEGSIAIGRVGDTSISSTKEINTNRITVGADRFIDNKALRGLAFSVGRNNVDVGNMGSNVDADTYNLTYYSTSPMKDDEKFVDTIIGIGKIHSDILTILDGKELTANRRGKQIFGTIKIKDEIKGDKFTLIPSGRFDIGHTLLDDYEEVGNGGIIVEKQHVRTKNLRAALAMVEDISNDKYTIKRHGKIEYRADIDRSSDFKYKYKEGSGTFTDTLHVGALHNISGELGIDIVFPENYSIFIIYERDQAIDYGHTDNLHIALGYLPNKNTNFSIQLEGIDNTGSNYVFSKNINDFILDFKLSNDLMNPTEYQEAAINLTGKF